MTILDVLPELLLRYRLPLERHCADTQFTPFTCNTAQSGGWTAHTAFELVTILDVLPELLLGYRLPLARYCADTQFTPLYATQHKVRVGQHTPPLSL